MRRIGVVTVGRSDYGILRPILRALDASPHLAPELLVSGAQLTQQLRPTSDEIEHDGRAIACRVEMPSGDDTAASVTESMGVGVVNFGEAYARLSLDALLLLGDRFEMLAAAVAAVPFPLPIAHVHGGEISEGAFDDRIRHAITKLSHLHFVTTATSAARVLQMGEESWRVSVSGAPALDALVSFEPMSQQNLELRIGLQLTSPPILLTFHPATLEADQAGVHVEAIVRALDAFDQPVVVTAPNADPGSQAIAEVLRHFVVTRSNAVFVESLGHHAYFSLMAQAAVMLGNSSSGLIEAPSFGLPVVNVGSRQAGRERASNVIDAEPEAGAVRAALARALNPDFRRGLLGVSNPFGDGFAGERIARVLPEQLARPSILRKRFVSDRAS